MLVLKLKNSQESTNSTTHQFKLTIFKLDQLIALVQTDISQLAVEIRDSKSKIIKSEQLKTMVQTATGLLVIITKSMIFQFKETSKLEILRALVLMLHGKLVITTNYLYKISKLEQFQALVLTQTGLLEMETVDLLKKSQFKVTSRSVVLLAQVQTPHGQSVMVMANYLYKVQASVANHNSYQPVKIQL